MSEGPREGRDPLGLLPDFHRSTRMPLDAVVRLHFEGTVAYQNGFAANVSALGMFVKHPEPPDVGTRLVFEFTLGEERKPVQGGGVVTWVRERYEGPGRPAGVGIQFTELDALSRQHIAESLFEYLETQLGVEVADHPDVPNLLAAMPESTMVDLDESVAAPSGEAEPAQAPLRFEPEPASGAPDGPSPSAADAEPFRLFTETPASGLPDDDGPATRDELFAPVTPPESFDFNATYGAAKRRQSPAWMPFAIAIGLAAAGFAGWWFLWGPGAEARTAPQAAATTAEAPAAAPAAPARPPLDPQPGATTLVEAVGAVPAAAAPASAGEEADADAAEPVVSEPAPAPAVAVPAVAVPAAPAPAADAVARSAGATRVSDIRWSAAGGGTAVTLVGDGAFRAGTYRWFEMPGDRPRVLVRLTGMAAGYPRSTLTAGTAELDGIRVGFHEKPGGNELHVVLDLADNRVKVVDVEAAADRLVVQLRRQ